MKPIGKLRAARCLAVFATVTVSPLFGGDGSLDFSEVIGLTVQVDDSAGVCNGSNSNPQQPTEYANILGGSGQDCPVRVAVTVTGVVETQNAGYDFVYVNDVLFFGGDEKSGECVMVTKTVTKTLTVSPNDVITLSYDTVDALYHVGGYATITDVQLIEEGCSSGCEPGGANLDNGSIHAAFNLGQADFGESVGALRIEEALPSGTLGTPGSLKYPFGWEEVDVILDLNDAIRQVKAPQCLADVVTENADRFRIDFYDSGEVGALSGGIYDQAGKTPFVTWVIENLDTVNNDHLVITQEKGAVSIENEFIWDATVSAWELVEGDGARKVKKSVVVDAGTSTRTITALVKDSADQVVSKRVEVYKDFAWGRELVSTVADPDGAALTTTRSYYDNSITDGGAYRKLKSVVRPDGGWVRYEYDANGRRTKAVESFLNASVGAAESASRVTTSTYSDNEPQETHVVTLLGQEISRRYKVNSDNIEHISQDIVCTVPGAAHTAATNLVTETKLVADGEFTGEVEYVLNPDGTGRYYSYSTAPTQKTTVVDEGEVSGGAVVDGTRTTRITDLAGNLITEQVIDIASGLQLSLRTVTATDDFGRPAIIDYNDGTTETINYGCCGVDSMTDREGITTSYTYDVFKRKLTETRAGIKLSYEYDPEGRILSRKRAGTDTSVITLETNEYDLAGRRISTRDALNHETTWAWSSDGSGRKVETVTYADTGTRVSVYHKDGSPYTVSGTAAAPMKWTYGVEAGVGAFTKTIRVGAGGSETEWTKSWVDHAGRGFKNQVAGNQASLNYYNTLGQLWKSVDPDGVTMLYGYDGRGRRNTQVLEMDRNDAESASDQIVRTSHQVLAAHGEVVRRTETRVVNVSGTEELASQADQSTDGLRQWSTAWGLVTTSSTSFGAGATRTETITRPDGSETVRSYTDGRLTGESTHASGGSSSASSVTYGYDAHGRRNTVTDARTSGTTIYTHNDLDQVTSVTTPVPGPGLSAQTTGYEYDEMGRVETTTLPDTSEQTNEYFLTGALKQQSGSQMPTVDYTYDTQGRVKTMVTHGQAGDSTTTWTYDGTSGELIEKTFADGYDVTYTYTDAGRLSVRGSDRGITRTYSYDDGGRVSGIDYSDATPDVAYTYNRLGQVTTMVDGSGTRSRTHATDGRLLDESWTAGLLNGASLIPDYDAVLRRDELSVDTGGSPFVVEYGFDGLSRINNVSSGSDSTAYTYEAHSSLISGVTTSRGVQTTLAVTRVHDNLGRLSSISASDTSSVVSSHAYSYDNLNRRTASTLEDGSEWGYGYDGMGQVTSAAKEWSDETPVLGAQFGYAYDGIGNRSSATVNGRTGTYTADGGNRYTQRQVPGAVDIRGVADPAATVSINNERVEDRKGGYYYQGVSVDNSAGPKWEEFSIKAVLNDAGPTGEDLLKESTGHKFLAGNPEIFTYDEEGNLLTDGRWSYTWDAENRLVAQESLAGAPVGSEIKLVYDYDGFSRRIRKRSYAWTGSAWSGTPATDTRFVYDGWNLVAELDASNAMTRNFVWGLDLSGSLEGAGGVGGLLSIREGSESYHPAYDGNGNVMALVRASDRATVGRYEYGPFGEVLRAEETGISNPFRFSTKYEDGRTGLLYYGYRYYDPVTGRWPSRDPIEEEGGENIYGFVFGNPTSFVDVLGNSPAWGDPSSLPGYTGPRDGNPWLPASDPIDGALAEALALVLRSPFLSCYLVDLTEDDALDMLAEILAEVPYEDRQFVAEWLVSLPGNWSVKFLGAASTVHNLSARIPQGAGLAGVAAHQGAQQTKNVTVRLIRRKIYAQSVSIVGKNGVKYFGRLGSKVLPFVGIVSLVYEGAKACHCYSVTRDGNFVRGEEFLNFGS